MTVRNRKDLESQTLMWPMRKGMIWPREGRMEEPSHQTREPGRMLRLGGVREKKNEKNVS